MEQPAQSAEPLPNAHVIREVCHQHEAAPAAIWDALEEKGIKATPGMVFEALHEEPRPDGRGLSAADMAQIGALATKAGGVQQLIRILEVWQSTPQ